jgi:UDP-sulfoquinovose synthase
MTVLICGADGYIGWPLSLHLAVRGTEKVVGVDNFTRRRMIDEIGSQSATPIQDMERRERAYNEEFGKENFEFIYGDLQNKDFVRYLFKKYQPRAIFHLGEQPSAPYSMIDVDHAVFSQVNNVVGTLNILFAMQEFAPDAHLIKLGTMGEYGTPNIDIPEGFFEVEFRGRKDTLPFPRQAGSWYHQSKVHDSNNIMFACRIWKLCSTDIMQGVVYGTRTEEMVNDDLLTRFDYDECFGTAINRYCAEAVIGHVLTPYGRGEQKRGFLALTDSIQCLTIALDNPPKRGEYRVFNQLDDVYSINELAQKVKKVASNMGLKVEIDHVENPRIEKEEHYYMVDHEKLPSLGFKPTRSLEEELEIMLTDLLMYRDRIAEKKHVIKPKIRWARVEPIVVEAQEGFKTEGIPQLKK